ncbi:hypothetical protein GEV33_013301 [Tenebrio molitor]|uniref:Uncharacterized protein n=1 Tax=Tenebrio molitor TaxID=7067 RepID=A0A8J6H857_TENMO|nr:hypothetical protein GEV33_013301 [Tenebrio molitor]
MEKINPKVERHQRKRDVVVRILILGAGEFLAGDFALLNNNTDQTADDERARPLIAPPNINREPPRRSYRRRHRRKRSHSGNVATPPKLKRENIDVDGCHTGSKFETRWERLEREEEKTVSYQRLSIADLSSYSACNARVITCVLMGDNVFFASKKKKTKKRLAVSISSREPPLLTQEDLHGLVGDLNVPKKKVELLETGLKGWNLLHRDTRFCDVSSISCAYPKSSIPQRVLHEVKRRTIRVSTLPPPCEKSRGGESRRPPQSEYRITIIRTSDWSGLNERASVPSPPPPGGDDSEINVRITRRYIQSGKVGRKTAPPETSARNRKECTAAPRPDPVCRNAGPD